MSQTVLIPFHITKLKAIQNIHMGRDVRSDIPVAEFEAFQALRTNYAVIYEYLVNQGAFPDGTFVRFEEKSSQQATVGNGRILAQISSMTTNYLGERARVAPREVEEAPAITDSGAVELVPGVDTVARAIAGGGPPVAVVAPQNTETGAVSAGVSPVEEVIERVSYDDIVWPEHTGAKIVRKVIVENIQRGDKKPDPYLAGQVRGMIDEWKKGFPLELWSTFDNQKYVHSGTFGGTNILMGWYKRILPKELQEDIQQFADKALAKKAEADTKPWGKRGVLPKPLDEARWAYRLSLKDAVQRLTQYALSKYDITY